MYTEFEKLAGVNSRATEEEFRELVKMAAYVDTIIKVAADDGTVVAPQDLGMSQDNLAQAAIVDATQKALAQQGVDADAVVDQVASNIAQDPDASAAVLNAAPADVNDLSNAVVQDVAQTTNG